MRCQLNLVSEAGILVYLIQLTGRLVESKTWAEGYRRVSNWRSLIEIDTWQDRKGRFSCWTPITRIDIIDVGSHKSHPAPQIIGPHVRAQRGWICYSTYRRWCCHLIVVLSGSRIYRGDRLRKNWGGYKQSYVNTDSRQHEQPFTALQSCRSARS